MRNKAVIGLGFGDEGKGRVVDYLCSKYKVALVVRYCGGHQAAHHVIANGVDHVFSNFGSGTLRGVPTYWSQFCTVDLFGLQNELESLKKKGASPILYIDEECPLTLTLDKYANLLDNQNLSNGTCGVGFGATIQRNEDLYRLCFGDLGFPSIVRAKYDLIRKYYKDMGVVSLIEDSIGDLDLKLLELSELECINPTSGLPVDFEFEPLLFEGSQGLLLDQDIGFFPHVTRANTGSKNILKIDKTGCPYLFLITRAYQTRHGIGPMTNEDIPNNISKNPYDKQDENGSQGKFRFSLLDLDLIQYSIQRDPHIRDNPSLSLCITCMDLVKDDLRLTYKGRIFVAIDEDEFIDKIRGTLRIDDVLISREPYGDLEQK